MLAESEVPDKTETRYWTWSYASFIHILSPGFSKWSLTNAVSPFLKIEKA